MKKKAFPTMACVVTGAFLILLVSSQFTRAQNQASQSTLEQQLKETEAEFRKSDAAMNELYQKLLSSLPPSGQEEFKNAQRAWIKSRNHSAATEETTTESHVSTLADHDVAIPDAQAADDILVFRYLKRETEDRIEELKKNYTASETENSPAKFEKIRDISPDGNFAMRISCSSEPEDPNNIDSSLITAVQLVSLPSKKAVMNLPQNYSGSAADLIWSQDSKWLAFSIYSGPRVSDTYVYHSSGDFFIKLEAQELRVDVQGDVRNEYVNPVRWVKPGVLLLEQNDVFRGEGKDANHRFTASFDDKTGNFRIISNKKVRSTVPH
jgi:uncharacterized protein YecT (DUF1311 family)